MIYKIYLDRKTLMEVRENQSPSQQRRIRMQTNLNDLASSNSKLTLSLRNEKSGQLANHLSIGSLNSVEEDEHWNKRSSSAIGMPFLGA